MDLRNAAQKAREYAAEYADHLLEERFIVHEVAEATRGIFDTAFRLECPPGKKFPTGDIEADLKEMQERIAYLMRGIEIYMEYARRDPRALAFLHREAGREISILTLNDNGKYEFEA